jgi:hypothetical protein
MLIEKAGHLIPMEKPAELTEIIKKILHSDYLTIFSITGDFL